MTNPVITLSCPSCGGKLQIAKSVNRFACGYCGNETIVHRESGIVYLEPIAEDIHHIRTGVDNIRGGVDKTAAELAIARLTRELDDLSADLKTNSEKKLSDLLPFTVYEKLLLFLPVILFIVATNVQNGFGGAAFLLSIVIFLFILIRRSNSAQRLKKEIMLEIKTEINETEIELAKNRKLV